MNSIEQLMKEKLVSVEWKEVTLTVGDLRVIFGAIIELQQKVESLNEDLHGNDIA